MAQKSGFFNALLEQGVYDRTYNADDYSDNLAVVIASGVLRSANDDLKVTASGLNLTVNAGRAWINGHYYYNTTPYALPAITTPTGATRIDRVILRFDNTITSRNISIQYLQGTAATSPVPPALTRTDTIYDLCLANITVAANASNVTVEDTRSDTDVCGWVYSTSGDNSFFTSLDNSFNAWFEQVKNTLSSVTLFKRYKYETTLASATTTVTFSIPQYDADTCFLEVYVNGILSVDFTQNGSTLTFSNSLLAGTEVIVYCFKSIDGTGIMSVADEITQLQNQVAALDGVSEFTYKATGTDDNISLSEIAQAFYAGTYDASQITEAANNFLTALGGTTFLQSLQPNSQITIDVVGKCGVTTAAYGSGTVSSRYRYFNFSVVSHTSLRLTFDFAKCDIISIDCADNTANIIFYGTDLRIRNASVEAQNSGSNCDIAMIIGSNVGVIDVENCNFEIHTSGVAKIAEHGTYTNCSAVVKSSASNAFCFAPNGDDLIRVIGGRFLAYVTSTTRSNAAIFMTYADKTNAVTIAQNVNCPTISLTGYYQQYLSVGNAGKTIIDGVVSTMNSTGSYNTIANQIWLSKQY
jgi:hypothetical protein